jgi:two-component system, sensor histidine kinase and response regulator
VVLLTSLGRRGDAAAAREAGLAAYLTKPIRESQLYDALVAALELSSADGHSSGARSPRALVTRHTLAERRAGDQVRVLLAEDNVINQQVAVRLFERLGCRADVAANGAEAVDAACRAPYRLIFMDCQMPQMDGLEATRRIREWEQRDGLRVAGDEPEKCSPSTRQGAGITRHIPIIAMTANAMEGDRERCLAAGMDDYLAKPITKEGLAGILRRWIPAPPADDHASPIDHLIFCGLQELAGEDAPDFVAMLVDHFLRDTPASLEQMRRAWQEAGSEELGRVAHRLKGSASNLGALRMAHVCEQVRLAADTNRRADQERALLELEQEFGRVRLWLERERDVRRGDGTVEEARAA